MRRIAGLLKKEMWEHGALVLGLLLLVGFVLMMLLIGALSATRTITILETHANFVRFFIPLIALALGNRLVVREYHGRTQRFLEALPIRRVEVVIVKVTAGIMILSIACMASLLLSALAAIVREPVTLRWLALVAMRSEVFVFVLWSVLFMMGLLGRWRIPIYLGIGLFLLILGSTTDVEIGRFGPFALVGDMLVLERQTLPLTDLWQSVALGAGALAAGFALALLGEGSIAEALSRRMTQREKATFAMAFVGGLIVLGTAGEKKTKEPFSFQRDEVVRTGGVEVLYFHDRHRRAAEEIAALLSSDRARLRRDLLLSSLAPVHIALRETLDARTVERVELEDADGILLRANFIADHFDRGALRSAALERVIEHATDGRALFEPHAWVRTGLAAMLAYEGESERVPAMRALWMARQRAPSWALLARWQRTEERYGPAAAQGVAYAAASTIVSLRTRARWLAFARSIVGEEPPWGMRAVWEERSEPPIARLMRHVGISERELIAGWRVQNERWRADPRFAELHAVPHARSAISIERGEGDLRTVRWSVRFTHGAPERESICTLVHAALGPFDRPLRVDELSREERPCAELASGGERLVGRYAPGERVLLAVEVDSPGILGAAIRVHSERREIP